MGLAAFNRMRREQAEKKKIEEDEVLRLKQEEELKQEAFRKAEEERLKQEELKKAEEEALKQKEQEKEALGDNQPDQDQKDDKVIDNKTKGADKKEGE